ncbi:ATP-binding protein [Candidatus Ruminimicrobium bovinum]|uniref:ATP-binding protein n=1 Tax=Candidatus Ruminimicrobium bovinum TaxID=3242779 RepID=UPI0039B9223F
MEIKRNFYLQQLIDSQDNGLVKIITGIRRCGKSYLLNDIFVNYLKKKKVKDSHIVKIDFDSPVNKKYYEPAVLYNYLKSLIKDKNKYYFLLDEIQLVKEFESVLNGLLRIRNTDIYVTGSNSKFLSSDVITEFRGRGDEIRIYPLSFSEMSSVYKDINLAWEDYYTYGGLPSVVLEKKQEKKINYLKYQANNVYLNDVIERNNLKHQEVLTTLTKIISSNIGSLTNPKKLANTFKSKNILASDKTIALYLGYLENAFLIEKSKRYDIKGKKYINTPLKYYFTDIGIRNCLLNFSQQEETHLMENIIYNELLIRGFNVDIGVVEYNTKKDNKNIKKQLEIDFVCIKGNNKYYIQSAFAIPDEEKMKQETTPLLKVNDAFKKIVIVKNSIKMWKNEYGVLIMDIQDFLLNPNSLDL